MANHRSSEIKVEDKLRSMAGRTYMYNTMNVQLLSWKYDGEYCTIATNGPWITRKISELVKFIDENLFEVEVELDPTGQNTPARQEPEAVLMPNIKGLTACDTLLDEILDSVKMVKTNKETAEQAGKVADLAGKVIGITKVQLDAFRFANELHRNR